MSRKVRICAAQYPIEALADWPAYVAKITRWVAKAAQGGADIAIFPEYGAMELASLAPDTMGDLAGSLASVAAWIPAVDALHADLARAHGLHILAASAPVHNGAKYVNRARLFTPHGAVGHQDKAIMTRFEVEQWHVSPGGPLRLFETDLGRIAIAICYDSEFPLIARGYVEAGAELLLVPSCTDTHHGYWRVRLGAQARALEGQCFVAHSPTVGDAPWSPAVDENRGAAAIYSPPDGLALGFDLPADGVIAIGEMDAAQWVFGDVDLAQVAMLRANGGVLNARDWAAQPGATPLPPVEIVDLRRRT